MDDKIVIPPELLEERPLPGKLLIDPRDLRSNELAPLEKLVRMLIIAEAITVEEYKERTHMLITERGMSSDKVNTDIHNMRKNFKLGSTFTWMNLQKFVDQCDYDIADLELTLVRRSSGKVVKVSLHEADDYRRTLV